MTAYELRTKLITEWAERFIEEYKFTKDIALQAATDIVDKGLTCERVLRKYKRKLREINEESNTENL